MFNRQRILIINSILRSHYPTIPSSRNISTIPQLSEKFFFKKWKKSGKQKRTNNGYIIEEPKKYTNAKVHKYYTEISGYLGVDGVSAPEKLKTKILSSKLNGLLMEDVDETSKGEILEVLELTINNGFNKQVPLDLSILIFDKLHNEMITRKPAFGEAVIKVLLSNVDTLPNITIIQLINYIQEFKMVNLKDLLKSLQNKRADYNVFIDDYLTYLKDNQKFTLQVFEELIELDLENNQKLLVEYFNDYIETLFKDHVPEIHCYKDLEYNLDRIQLILNSMIDKLNFSTIPVESLITVFKLNWELLSANKCEASTKNHDRILNYLQDKIQSVKEVIFKQDLDDESLVETLLFTSWKFNIKLLANEITEFVLNDDSRVYQLAHNQQTGDLCEDILSEDLLNDLDSLDAYERTIQALMTTSHISPTDEIIGELASKFADSEQSVLSYKYRLDNAIENHDHAAALKIYNDSVARCTTWTDYTNDPSVSRTLNDLIQCLVTNMPMKQAFPIFQNIKSNLQSQVNIDTINAIVPKILEENLTGDVIELMTRELPKIARESPIKLPIEKDYGYKYYKLFDTVHTYCITNTSDSRMVNNWYLYTHCYNYFFIPHERLLPTMKFFCENNRWNGALRIFKTSIEMSQLHGEHAHKPPTKEMYLYLITEFGDKLYEDGVIEVHESMKMDINLPNQDKDLLHSIMNAYCNLQDVGKVRDLFLAMSSQPKELGGVDETSATIMLKAYTYNDLMYVEKFWNNLSFFGLAPDYQMFKQYLIAYSYHGLVDKAIEIANSVEEYDLELSSDLLISMNNFCYQIEGQEKLRDWAATNHPEMWKQALDSGKLLNAAGYIPNENFLVSGGEESPKYVEGLPFK
ncbi:hypothetical protein SBY92_000739 [Candida maltosa Xu316]